MVFERDVFAVLPPGDGDAFDEGLRVARFAGGEVEGAVSAVGEVVGGVLLEGGVLVAGKFVDGGVPDGFAVCGVDERQAVGFLGWLVAAAPAGEDGGAAVGQFAEHGEGVDAGAGAGLPGELAGGEVVGAQVGPVGFCATVLFGAGLGGGFHGQVVGGRVVEDDFAVVEDGFVGSGVMAAEGRPDVRPLFVAVVVETLDCAADVGEDHALAVGHGRISGIVVKQAGEVRGARAGDDAPPEFLAGSGVEAHAENVAAGCGVLVDRLVRGHEDASAGNDGRALAGARQGRAPLHVFAGGAAEIRRRVALHNEIAVRPGGLRPCGTRCRDLF